jgi:hypothetical protein
MFNVGIYRNLKPAGGFGVNLTEHEARPRDLTDLLPWALFLEPGLIVNKDGAFMKVVGFRGPDLASSTPAQLVAARGRLNNAIRRLGSRWCLHVEARRRRAPEYPRSRFPDPITQALDDERRQAFERRRVPAYESDFYLTFTYLPPDERLGRAEAALLENARRGSLDDAYTGEKVRFMTAVESVVAILEGFVPYVRPLSDEQTLAYLHDCVSERPGYAIACPEMPFGLDGLLRDTALLGGLEPQLGRLHLRTIGINAYPGRTTVGLLDALNNLPFSYRWVTRYLPLDKQDATKGEHGELVVYADRITRTETDENGAETEREVPFMKGYTVFNAEQCEGLPAHFTAKTEAPSVSLPQRIDAADRFFAATAADIRHGGTRAFYAEGPDYVQMPPFETFRDAERGAGAVLDAGDDRRGGAHGGRGRDTGGGALASRRRRSGASDRDPASGVV